MSKMGQELDRKLDENKYELWEALRELRDWLKSDGVEIRGEGLCEYFGVSDTMEKVDKVLDRVGVS